MMDVQRINSMALYTTSSRASLLALIERGVWMVPEDVVAQLIVERCGKQCGYGDSCSC